MRRTAALSAALLVAWSGCKTPDSAETASAAKDFDTGADPTLSISFDDVYAFCPKAERFNVVNAYWLTLASAYVYATKAELGDVGNTIRQEWKAVTLDFLSSPDSLNPIEPSTQALWIEGETTAVLAFRGTPLDRIDAQDIVSDVKALQVPFAVAPQTGKVHKGFQLALESVWPQLEPKLKALAGSGKALFVTGHSLGGALATLTTARILLQPDLAEMRSTLRGLYTIGSPRVGNADFVAKVEAARKEGFAFPIVRMRNGQDIVTRVPSLGYKHLGPVFYVTESGMLYSEDPQIGARYKMTPGVAQQIKEGFVVTQLGELKEHLPIRYFERLSAEYRAHKAWLKATNGDPCADAPFYQTPQQAPTGSAPGVQRLADLEKLGDAELRAVFAEGIDDVIPSTDTATKTADGKGLPIILPGAVLVNNLAYTFWEGKKFTTREGATTLVNKLGASTIDDISAKVYRIPESLSFGDGRGSILLDYSGSNRIAARAIRDEIRRVGPGVYLGRAHIENHQWLWPVLGRYKFVIWFGLGFGDSGTGI